MTTRTGEDGKKFEVTSFIHVTDSIIQIREPGWEERDDARIPLLEAYGRMTMQPRMLKPQAPPRVPKQQSHGIGSGDIPLGCTLVWLSAVVVVCMLLLLNWIGVFSRFVG